MMVHEAEKAGFTLIEIVIVILIIGIITAVSVPRLFRSPVSQTEQFVGRLNTLMQEAVESAQQSGMNKRVFFNIAAKSVAIQSIAGKQEGRAIEIPAAVEISEVFINGKSAFALGAGEKRDVYLLINADGISQEVRLVLVNHAVRSRSPQGGAYEFYLNPFTSVFRLR